MTITLNDAGNYSSTQNEFKNSIGSLCRDDLI